MTDSSSEKKLRPTQPPANKCLQNRESNDCPLVCKYNHFESEDLTIHAWELKCLDCGWRDTIGFRSDEDEPDESVDPSICPFCSLAGLCAGKNPCEKIEGSKSG